jgi:hypothetical protein
VQEEPPSDDTRAGPEYSAVGQREPGSPISIIETYRIANVLIKQYGAEALSIAVKLMLAFDARDSRCGTHSVGCFR